MGCRPRGPPSQHLFGSSLSYTGGTATFLCQNHTGYLFKMHVLGPIRWLLVLPKEEKHHPKSHIVTRKVSGFQFSTLGLEPPPSTWIRLPWPSAFSPRAFLYQVASSLPNQSFSTTIVSSPPSPKETILCFFYPSCPPSPVKGYYHRSTAHLYCLWTTALWGATTIVQ